MEVRAHAGTGCATMGPGRQVRDGTALRTSAECATEGRSSRSAFQGGRRNVPRRGLGAASCFARARRCTGPPAGDAWKAGSLEMRTHAGTECATEGPGRQVRVLLVRAGAKDPLLEMRGRQVRWKCAHTQGRNVPCWGRDHARRVAQARAARQGPRPRRRHTNRRRLRRGRPSGRR